MMKDLIDPDLQTDSIAFSEGLARTQWRKKRREQFIARWKSKGLPEIQEEINRRREVLQRAHERGLSSEGERETWEFAALQGLADELSK